MAEMFHSAMSLFVGMFIVYVLLMCATAALKGWLSVKNPQALKEWEAREAEARDRKRKRAMGAAKFGMWMFRQFRS